MHVNLNSNLYDVLKLYNYLIEHFFTTINVPISPIINYEGYKSSSLLTNSII